MSWWEEKGNEVGDTTRDFIYAACVNRQDLKHVLLYERVAISAHDVDRKCAGDVTRLNAVG